MASKGKDNKKEPEKEEEKTNEGQGQEEDKKDQEDKGREDKGQGDQAYSGRTRQDGSRTTRSRRSGRVKRKRRTKSSKTARSRSRRSDNSDDNKKTQKEYFKEELKRLKRSLDKEASKIKAPEKKEHTPNIFNKLEPYCNTDTPHFLIESPEQQVRHGYVSRQTAHGLCDPWIDHEMDVTLLPKVESKHYPAEEEKKKKQNSPRNGEGSTRLPKFPAVCIPTDDLTKNKLIDYSHVPGIREELRKKYSINAEGRIEAEYNRTKQDFYRMELDKMEDYHPTSRPKMKATYYAYLQNTPGSRKAVRECVKETDKKKEKDKQQNQKNQDKQQNQKNQQAVKA